MEPKYLPLGRRVPDTQFKDRLKQIKERGFYTKSRFQTEGTYTLLTVPPMVFELSNGFPILTERKIGFWRKPISELFAFLNGVRDAEVLAERWGVNWWKENWATPEKCAHFGLAPYDMGPGSYGPAFASFPHFEWEEVVGHPDGGRFVPKPFNQMVNLIKQIKEFPEIRTHKVSTWIPQYCLQHEELVRQVVVAPCHGDIQITILDKKLHLRMDQRSADFPIGVPSNMIQYAALMLAICSITGHEPGMFIHAPHDCQIYDRHKAEVDEIINRKSLRFPSMHLTEEGKKITNILEFRSTHFELKDYESHPAIKLADAVI
jgi:thymidylate synthase